jgi:uncharacterized protein
MTAPVIHFEIGGRDGGRMTSFYRELFGWQPQPAGPGYWLVPGGKTGIGGGLMQTSGDMPPYVTVYVAVPDLRTTLDRAAELGGKTIVEPTAIPGVGQFALFTDPDGNVVGLLYENGVRR